MSNNNYDIKQAVKACLINYLEDKYQKEIESAIFEAEVSEKVILLRQLSEQHYTVRHELENCVRQIIEDAAFSVPQDSRNLSKEQEEMIDVIVDNAANTNILLLVNDCKNLLNI